eukprot:4941472-Pleurochrysis_carterae.AAC.1
MQKQAFGNHKLHYMVFGCTMLAEQLDSWLQLDGLGSSRSSGSMGCESQAVRNFVRQRFGNHAREVLNCMRVWEAYYELHSAWREERAEDTIEYRALRAL